VEQITGQTFAAEFKSMLGPAENLQHALNIIKNEKLLQIPFPVFIADLFS
jgi:hypothetical protein